MVIAIIDLYFPSRFLSSIIKIHFLSCPAYTLTKANLPTNLSVVILNTRPVTGSKSEASRERLEFSFGDFPLTAGMSSGDGR